MAQFVIPGQPVPLPSLPAWLRHACRDSGDRRSPREREREGTHAQHGEGEGVGCQGKIIVTRRLTPHLPIASRGSEASAVSVRRSIASPGAAQWAPPSPARGEGLYPARGEGFRRARRGGYYSNVNKSRRCYHLFAMTPFFTYPGLPQEEDGGAAGVSLRRLISMRWVAVGGQAAALLVVHFGLGFDLPIVPTLAVVAASALINLGQLVRRRPQRRLSERDATFTLAYDVLQLGLLLFLTGGLENPFAILMIAPVTVAATILSRRSVIFLCT